MKLIDNWHWLVVSGIGLLVLLPFIWGLAWYFKLPWATIAYLDWHYAWKGYKQEGSPKWRDTIKSAREKHQAKKALLKAQFEEKKRKWQEEHRC